MPPMGPPPATARPIFGAAGGRRCGPLPGGVERQHASVRRRRMKSASVADVASGRTPRLARRDCHPIPQPDHASPMSRHADLVHRLQRRLACHQALHDPAREPRNGLRWLPELRRWQAARLERSFERFLDDPRRARPRVSS